MRKLAGLLVGIFGSKGYVDVEAGSAGRFAVGWATSGFQYIVNDMSSLHHLVEGVVIGGVDIHHYIIRMIRSLDFGIPRIDLNATEVGHVDKRGLIVAYDIVYLFVGAF